MEDITWSERVTFLPCPSTLSYDPSSFYQNNTESLFDLDPTTTILDLGRISYIIHSEDGSNILNNVTCDKDWCYVICNGSVSCFGSSIYCGSETCNIDCENLYSCTNTKIYSDPNGTESISLLCDGESACSNSEIYIENVEEFKLVCNTPQSCDQLFVNISGYNDLSEIYCQSLSLHIMISCVW